MAFHFNEKDLIYNFAKDNPDVPELEFMRQEFEGIEIQALSGGMVNYIFRVQSSDKKQTIIIKYGEETMRLDQDEHVSLDRQVLEYDSLVLMNSILPGSAPKPYCLDRKHNIIAMEDLGDMDLVRKVLAKGDINLDAAKNLGKLLGIIHRETTRGRVSTERWTELDTKFGKMEQVEFYNAWVIERIFVESDPAVKIPPGVLETYRKCVLLLEPTGYIKKLSELFSKQVCFIHADCYFESILIKGTRVALFDFEFAYMSHPAMHLGWVISIYPYLMLKAFGESELDVQQLITINKQAVGTAVKEYFAENDTLKDKKKQEDFLKEVTLFTGHGMFLFAHWVSFDAMVNQTDEHKIWLTECGTQLMLNHEHITTTEQLLEGMFANVENMAA